MCRKWPFERALSLNICILHFQKTTAGVGMLAVSVFFNEFDAPSLFSLISNGVHIMSLLLIGLHCALVCRMVVLRVALSSLTFRTQFALSSHSVRTQFALRFSYKNGEIWLLPLKIFLSLKVILNANRAFHKEI